MGRVRDTLRLWFSLRVPVSPREYFVTGIALMVVKYLVDATVMWFGAHAFWSPIDYLNPSYVLRESRFTISPAIRTAMVLWTLPFLWIGASMSVRRAVDAGRSAWVGLLFFVPVVNYVLMLVLSRLPSRAPLTPPVAAAASEASGSASEASVSKGAPAIDPRIQSALQGLGACLVLGIPLALFCTVFLKNYGLGLFFGTPFVVSVVTGFLHNRPAVRPVSETLLVATIGLGLVAGSLLLFAVEGVVCVAMAFPLAVPIVWMGSLFGREIAR